MAIATYKPTSKVPTGKSLPEIQPKDYKSVVVNVAQDPVQSLITYTNGYAWTCVYYSQVINSGNDLKALDPSQPKAYQQYRKIKDFQIKVEDPLSESQDEKTKLMTVNGTGMVLNGIVPEAGDMFIASAGTGNTGLFVINKTDRKSYFTDSVFEIEYSLLGYLTDPITSQRVNDLEDKVIETLYYNKLYNQYKKSELLTTDQYLTQESLQRKLRELINFFFDEFWAHGYQNITVPRQSFPIYDSFVERFLRRILDTTDNYNFMSKRVPFTNYDCGLEEPTVFNVLINRNASFLSKCKTAMGLASTAYFAGNALLLSIAYSGLAYVVYPSLPSINPGVLENDPMTYWGYSFDGPLANMKSALTNECAGLPLSQHHLHNELIVYNATNVAGENIPIVKPAFFEQTYVFSPDFYRQSGLLSVLEAQTLAYINRQELNPGLVNLLATDYINWTKFDQFYYIPVIILLIKHILRTQ
jgi:hypothetical protein